MKTHVPITEFKAKTMLFVKEIEKHHIEIILTRKGKPFAKISPIEDFKKNYFGDLKGTVKELADLTKPLNNEWEICQ